MGVYYIGAFPIEGGGVTIKNRDLFIALKEKGVQIKAIDLNKITRGRNLWELVRLLVVLVCPWNRFARPTEVAYFQPSAAFLSLDDTLLNDFSQADYQRLFAHSAVKRAKYEGLLRNSRVYLFAKKLL